MASVDRTRHGDIPDTGGDRGMQGAACYARRSAMSSCDVNWRTGMKSLLWLGS
ncbi:hypothetical protein STVIR_1826 [Streptomyces viridochromogenes Tue57]|uniref:Uncharacterized protein n=1 Tax=Streptomyces viridochromogenes Tue57 TaxID=1160705 RepID=L8PI09_STRVR|nr:hypothetical protein STVIR_1826 [Streptomyces viridochromogenes Tue57]